MMLPSCWLWLAFGGMVSAAPAGLFNRGAPLPPSQDPFYQAPAGYESATPGSILKSRTIPYPLAFEGKDPLRIRGAYQLLYRTTDSHGNAEAAITTVLVPNNANPTKLVSYQTAEDSSFVDCGPSYTLQQNSTDSQSFEELLILAALDHGCYVSVPDYEGPQAAFVAGIQAGHAVLDSIRAAKASNSLTGLSSTATTVMWGYSGGSLASGWAAQLQPTYAPELQIAGAALGGTVPNITSVLYTINKGPAAGLVPAGVLGLAGQYPDLESLILSQLKPETAPAFLKVRSQCLSEDTQQFAGQDLFAYFKDPAIFQTSVPQAVLEENRQGKVAPKIPIYIYKAIFDEISPSNDTNLLVSEWCAGGTTVQYDRDLLAEHTTLAILGAPAAFNYLEDRLSGVPVALGCSSKEVVSSLATAQALATFGTVLISDLADLLQKPVGPFGW